MTPNLSRFGHSFSGAMAYFMHDKLAEGIDPAALRSQTSERVAWTETRNLAGVGPHTATRVMIDHAQQAEALKLAHGGAMTGRKSNAHVSTFSLSWRPDEVEGLDKAGMLRAAEAALKFMKADHLQAVIIAHNDTAHPHVHVILNRVQANGVMWNPSFTKNKFSEWANRYEHENGKIVSPKRAEKWDKIEQGQAAHPDAEQRRKYTADRKAAQSAQAKAKEPSPGQILKDLADAQKARHAREWRDFGAQARRGYSDIRVQHGGARREAELAFKAGTKGDWAQHFRDERTRARTFEKRERSLGGIIRNAFDAARTQAARKPGEHSLFGLAVANILSSAARRDAFATVAEGRSIRMREAMRERKAQAMATIDAARKSALETLSRKILDDRAALMERQRDERAKMSEAWRQHYAQKAAQQPGPTYRRRKAEPLRKADPRPVSRPAAIVPPERQAPKPIAPAFAARAAGWVQGRASEAFAAVQHVAADLEQRRKYTADRKAAPPPPAVARPSEVATTNQARAGAESRPAVIEDQPMRKDWKHLVEDRAIMSGAEPTNTENMRRRDADAGRTYEPPAHTEPPRRMSALERRLAIIAAKERANTDPTPTPPKPTQRRRMKF